MLGPGVCVCAGGKGLWETEPGGGQSSQGPVKQAVVTLGQAGRGEKLDVVWAVLWW